MSASNTVLKYINSKSYYIKLLFTKLLLLQKYGQGFYWAYLVDTAEDRLVWLLLVRAEGLDRLQQSLRRQSHHPVQQAQQQRHHQLGTDRPQQIQFHYINKSENKILDHDRKWIVLLQKNVSGQYCKQKTNSNVVLLIGLHLTRRVVYEVRWHTLLSSSWGEDSVVGSRWVTVAMRIWNKSLKKIESKKILYCFVI